MRSPFQILVIPFKKNINQIKVAIFKRKDSLNWQFIAGGGEKNETFLEAAKRESYEEANIKSSLPFFKLSTISSIPKNNFKDYHNWNNNIYVIPEYCFAVEIVGNNILLSKEHSEYKWVSIKEAQTILCWDSNKTALWELEERIKSNDLIL
jgi:dATP pyrophosphohydrolase